MVLHDIVKKGSTDRSVVVTILDSTDGTPETGVVYNTAGIDLWYRREGAAVTSITEATLASLTAAHTDGGFLAISHGEYRLDLPDAAYATGANYVDFGGTVTGMVVIGGRVRLVDYDLEDSVRLGLTALPNAAADAAGGLPISDAGGLDLDAIYEKAKLASYIGPNGIGVYIDSGAANTNTVFGTDGTFDNPVSTPAAARTIADAMGINRYYLEGNSDTTLGATHADWEFYGIGSVRDNTLNFGSSDVSRSKFHNLSLEGTQGGTGRIEAVDCALQDPGAGVSTFNIHGLRCGIVDDITLDTSDDNVLIDSYSLVAGTGTPIVRASGAAGTLVMNGHKGGVDLRDLSASHNLTINIAGGQCIFDASNNVNASVSLRGIGTKTDNTAGMAALVETAFINMDKINTECDTAISDAALATAANLATAQTDLDTITGADGVTLASTQPNSLSLQPVTITAGDAIANITLAGSGTENGISFTRSGSGDPFDANFITQIQSGIATEAKQNAQDLIITEARLAELDAANLPATTDTINTNVAALPAIIDDLSIKKNTAGLIHFEMVLASDHVSPSTGLTVTAQRLIDSGVYASVSGTITEISNGSYRFDYLAADCNGDIVTWKFSGAGADDTKLTFKTVV